MKTNHPLPLIESYSSTKEQFDKEGENSIDTNGSVKCLAERGLSELMSRAEARSHSATLLCLWVSVKLYSPPNPHKALKR